MQITVEVPEIRCVRCPATGAVTPNQLRRLQSNAQAPIVATDSQGGRWFVQAEKPADWQELTGKDGGGYLCPACVELWKAFVAPPPPEPPPPPNQSRIAPIVGSPNRVMMQGYTPNVPTTTIVNTPVMAQPHRVQSTPQMAQIASPRSTPNAAIVRPSVITQSADPVQHLAHNTEVPGHRQAPVPAEVASGATHHPDPTLSPEASLTPLPPAAPEPIVLKHA